jgi:hypothetical protein
MLIVGAFRFSAHQPATLRQLADGINPTLQTLCRRGEGLIKQKPHRRPIFRARCVLGLPRQKLKPHNKRLSHVVRGHRTYHSMLLALIERFRDQPNAKHRLFGFVQKLHLPIAMFFQIPRDAADQIAAYFSQFSPSSVAVRDVVAGQPRIPEFHSPHDVADQQFVNRYTDALRLAGVPE